MMSGRYIIGNESYNIFLDFPKDSEWNFKFEIIIFNILIFWLEIWSKIPNFPPKNENVENYDLKLEISFWIFRKLKRDVRTFISYDIAIRNHDLMDRSSYVSETAFSCIKIHAFFPLYIFYKKWFVAWKVNTCWPKLRIWKYRLSAFYSYLQSSQTPSGHSGRLYIAKNVSKRFMNVVKTAPGQCIARYIWCMIYRAKM